MTEDASSVSLGGETVKGTIAKITMAGIGFAGTVVFARLLGPEEFGQYHLLLAVVILTIRPVSGGWSSAAKKRASEVQTSEREIVGAQLLVGALWLASVGVVVVVFADWLRSYTGVANAVLLFVVLLGSKLFYESLVPVIAARGRLGISVGLDALRSYLTFPLQAAFVLIGMGVTGMVYGLAGGTLLTTPIALYYLHKRPTLPSREVVRSMWEFARYSIPSSMLLKTYDKFDPILLGFLLVPSAVAQYEVAAKLTLPAVFLAEIAGGGLMARVSNLQSRGDDVANDVTNVISFTSILSLPMFFGALAISKPLVVTIYGGEFEQAASLLIGLALFRIFGTQSFPLIKVLHGLDMPDLNLKLSGVALGVNIVLGVVLTIRFGAIGVVAATVAAEAIRYAGTVYVLKRELPEVGLFPRELAKQVAASAVMFVVVSALHTSLSVQSWVDLGVLLAAGATTYSIILLSISPRLRLTIASVLHGSRIERFTPDAILRWR